MSPETTIKKVRKAPAATSVQHIVRASSRTQHRGTHTRTTSSLATRPISLQVPANRPDQRSASPQLKQPSSTSTVRRGGLSTASPCTFLCVCFSVYVSLCTLRPGTSVGEPTVIAKLQHTVPSLWLSATWVGVAPTCLQNISSTNVQGFVIRRLSG